MIVNRSKGLFRLGGKRSRFISPRELLTLELQIYKKFEKGGE